MKKIATLLGFILLTSFQQQEKTVTITLTISQTQTVLQGLSELPYKQSAQIIELIQQQAQKQLQPEIKK